MENLERRGKTNRVKFLSPKNEAETNQVHPITK